MLGRFLRHLCATRWNTRRRFSLEVLAAIEAAVRDVEARHSGEIRFAVETALDIPELLRRVGSRERAQQVFAQLGVWDTAQNNGVLIYVLLADRVVEIVADRGIAARIAPDQWETVCREIQRQFREGRFEAGAVGAVQAVGQLLAAHFPVKRGGGNELPNQPVLL